MAGQEGDRLRLSPEELGKLREVPQETINKGIAALDQALKDLRKKKQVPVRGEESYSIVDSFHE